MFFTSLAYAMGQAPEAGAQPGGPLMTFMPLILMFVIFYVLLIRPQQKKQKEHKQMLDNLTRGDRIVTTGGLHGRIVEVKDNVLVVDVGNNIQVEIGRGFIAALINPDTAGKTAEKKK
ncbi:MAG: preprotein translocase subunit YajC [Desulfomicrobium sp.]|jgi:preprotein translocase subunit YajC|nr:preprotein translocase subunit YajC [Desulfomicrobium sp.]NLV96184.1 preprotein translocase subunit YajC [Desulfovibrionales bacterium]